MGNQLNIRIPEEAKSMLAIKAAVYARGNVSAFVREAIERYQAPLPGIRCLCGEMMEQTLMETVTWPQATFLHVPMHRCVHCGREVVDEAVSVIMDDYAQRQESLDFSTVVRVPQLQE